MNIKGQLVLCLVVKLITSEQDYQCDVTRTRFSSRKCLSKTPCDLQGAALVEQFFNIIFAEFLHSPPICTCVQMCADQPTYCYPNGCYKKAERKKETSPVSSIQQDAKTVFLVDNSDITEDLMVNRNLMIPAADNTEKSFQRPRETNLVRRSNPLKEIVFKYKRLPKLQMKYNLREQIKHSRDKKAEIDLTKTRWPTNKQINRQINHPRTSNYFMSAFPETNQPETSKYFKRYLTKRENQIGLDISALYLYKDASNFSLETLIDNLIERGLEGINGTTFKTSKSSELKDEENNVNTNFKSVVEDFQNDTNEIAVKITLKEKDTVNNNTNKYEDRSKYTSSSTAAYFDMITTLSNQIDKQNNVSMGVMENLTGNRFNDISDFKSSNILNISTIEPDRFKTASEVTVKPTTNTVPTSPIQYIPVINNQVKKSKQRIVRKLRNRKLN